ncbi:MAG: O-antigen ligase family protein [Pseudomonadota bacterium]
MTPLLGLVAIGAVFFRPAAPRPSFLLAAFAILIIWVSASTLWSPALDTPVFSGSLADGNFAIKFSALRLVGIALATGVSIAVLQSSKAYPRHAATLLAGIFGVHLAMLLATPPLLDRGLAMAYETQIEAQRDGMQNVLRFANALALVLPVLLAAVWTRGGWVRNVGVFAIAPAVAVFAFLGSAAAILAVVLTLLFVGLVIVFPRSGFRVIYTGIAVMVMAAPLLGRLAGLFDTLNLNLPLSFQSRVWAWHAVTEKVSERPITGHGLEAASTWRETYLTRPEWLADVVSRGGVEAAWTRYPLIPSHPHNMALEIWAETGLIGAILTATTLIALGFRLPPPAAMSQRLKMGAAGLTGAALAIASVSYSVWNEAFWASLVLVTMALIILARAERA